MTLEWMVTVIMSAAAGVLLLASLTLRRRRLDADARIDRWRDEASAAQESARLHAAGERESTWALQEAARRIERLEHQQGEASQLAGTLHEQIDDLKLQLATADGDLSTARREAEEATTEAVRLESEISHLESEMADLREELLQAKAQDEAKTPEGDRDAEAEAAKAELVARAEGLSADLETAHNRVTALEEELARLRDEASQPPPEPDRQTRERLVASEAHRRDLEDRLNALHAVRATEQRRAAEQAAIADRLHVSLAEREERIESLEMDLKQAEESRDDAVAEATHLQVQISRLKTDLAAAESSLADLEQQGEALEAARQRIAQLEEELAETASATAELDRLRRSLEAERARAERISRRSVDGVPTDATYAMWEQVVRDRVDSAVDRETERLRERIEHLRLVVSEKEERIRALTGGKSIDPAGEPTVTDIKGIGTKIAQILASRDITTVEQIAALTPSEVEALGEHMPIYPDRIVDDDWVGQARALLD